MARARVLRLIAYVLPFVAVAAGFFALDEVDHTACERTNETRTVAIPELVATVYEDLGEELGAEPERVAEAQEDIDRKVRALLPPLAC